MTSKAKRAAGRYTLPITTIALSVFVEDSDPSIKIYKAVFKASPRQLLPALMICKLGWAKYTPMVILQDLSPNAKHFNVRPHGL
ncbi:uncharacterized protein L203_103695 [Cryptococcus depauperatus CBS 7841]|uniref:Uncharacterized protein n=1 Tax=Cryptococcus depauperatus CBS 7841 TaxID=1295531 RepID=A0AAJ8JU45_9TREE